MAITSIPPELSDIVIDFLHDDKKALLSCSLVAKSWLASSRYHLFHSLQLVKPTNTDRPIPERTHILEFRMKALPSAIMEFVQTFKIRTPMEHPFYHLDTPLLCHVLERMKRVSTFDISRVHWNLYPFETNHSSIPTLRFISLHVIAFPCNPHGLARAMSQLFPNLQTIDLVYPSWEYDSESPESTATPDFPPIVFPGLRRLAIDNGIGSVLSSRAPFSDILGSSHMPALEDFELVIYPSQHTAGLIAMVDHHADRLLRLRLIYIGSVLSLGFSDIDKVNYPLVFSKCKNMEAFTIQLPVVDEAFEFSSPILSSHIRALPPTIREILIQLSPDCDDLNQAFLRKAIPLFDWSEIDEALSRLSDNIHVRFSAVSSLQMSDGSVDFTISPLNEATAALLLARLPRAHSRVSH